MLSQVGDLSAKAGLATPGGPHGDANDGLNHGQRASPPRRRSLRTKQPFWQDGRVKLSKEARGTQSLCVSTWRAQLAPGAAVVFSPCLSAHASGRHVSTNHALAQQLALLLGRPAAASGAEAGARLQLGGSGNSSQGLCITAQTEGIGWRPGG